MICVVVPRLNSNQISALLTELNAMGYTAGRDFDFAYRPGRYDYEQMKEIDRYTTFTWYNESAGTWFALRWS